MEQDVCPQTKDKEEGSVAASFGSELVSEEVDVEAGVQEGDLAAAAREQLMRPGAARAPAS